MSYITVNADVDVDISACLSELSDEDLLNELVERKLNEDSPRMEQFQRAYDFHLKGRESECNAILHEIMADVLNRVAL